ncbi:ABC transporter permease subunit [Sodalis-like endosymbiont of Proechinophthirus fluctus]|uniref:ABC transporter permease subunit n=1 Tax=Sodalis-like endosymbiont of Proechinophthirus fluctus TaxID=1462730 RepID=UPI00210FA868|nr:ABC transporter permease subunit [Sodalis-like endosymbiont of Proechinophthirus fluctus]
MEEATQNVGSGPWKSFWKITFQLTMPGVYAGMKIIFPLNFSTFSMPLMIGNSNMQMLGLIIYHNALLNNDLPLRSALSVIMSLVNAAVIIGLIFLFNRLFFVS